MPEFDKEQFAEFTAKIFLSFAGVEYLYFPLLITVLDWINRHKEDFDTLTDKFGEFISTDGTDNSNFAKVMKLNNSKYLFVYKEALDEYFLKILNLSKSIIEEKYYLNYYELDILLR